MILNPLWAVAFVYVYSFIVFERTPRVRLYAPVWKLTCVEFHPHHPPLCVGGVYPADLGVRSLAAR